MHSVNSQSLQKNFPRIYQDFFSQSIRVVSTPHSFYWFGDASSFAGGLAVLQKIPRRLYVGLQPIQSGRFQIEETLLAYHPRKNNFEVTHLDHQLIKRLHDLLGERLAGWRLRLLSEVRLGSSLGFLGALSAGLSRLLQNSDHQPSLVKTAQAIVKNLQTGRSSAATAYTALVDGGWPTVYLQGREYPDAPSSGVACLPRLAGRQAAVRKQTGKDGRPDPETPTFHGRGGRHADQLISQLTKTGHRRLFDEKVSHWPIDFGLIFSGDLVNGPSVIASNEELKESFKQAELDLEEQLGLKSVIGFWETLELMLDTLAKKGFLALRELLIKGNRQERVRALFNTMNQYHNLLQVLEVTTVSIGNIYSAIHRLADIRDNQVGSGVKLTGIGRGGEVLFALPLGRYREGIEKLMSQLKNQGSYLEYASWRDGVEAIGVRVEQDVSTNCLHSLLPSNQMILIVYINQQRQISLTNSLERAIQSADLVLDRVNRKVYVKGHSVSSKELPSQSATVEILSALLQSSNRTLLNHEIPVATYASSRYDLQSKIVIPLQALTKRRGQSIRLMISGGLYDNYRLSIQPTNAKIGVIANLSLSGLES